MLVAQSCFYKMLLNFKEFCSCPIFCYHQIVEMDETVMFKTERALLYELSSNEPTVVKESAWFTSFPLETDHVGHVVGEVALLYVCFANLHLKILLCYGSCMFI